jgi:hypothetical protein
LKREDHTFLVRAADDAAGHDHGASLMMAKEGLDLLADNRIVAYIDVFGEPVFEHIVPPNNSDEGWIWIGGYTNCCGVEYAVVTTYIPDGCESAKLRMPESQRHLLALMNRDKIFVLGCKDELTRHLPAPVRKSKNISVELPIKFEFPGEQPWIPIGLF